MKKTPKPLAETTETSPAKPEGHPPKKEKPDALPIVGIGASAGGLEALELFLKNVPEKSGMAFVIIQHLDPTHKGIMPELLQRHTKMPVTQAGDHLKVKPDHVYVIPPNKDMSILHGVLHLFVPSSPRGLRLPVDFFFRSLAEDRLERSVGIILSGMGTDGTLGVKAIKEVAGLVLVQDPATAKFDGMPRSAMDTGLVDVVAPAEELFGKLAACFGRPPALPPSALSLEGKAESALEKVVILLRTHTRHDFSLYKKSTLYRRIERRMRIHQIDRITQYVRYLQENPQERTFLFKELLIGVTGFFRDPAAWEFLKQQVFPALFAERPDGGMIRAWTPGCSTGEEAFSLGMVFREALDQVKPGRRYSLQIFATDLDQDAIGKARQGLYPPNISADVTPERLKRFFVSEDTALEAAHPGGYRIGKEIRDMVTMATQNVLMDPPFTKLDLLVCRNLLIYLEPEAQKKLLPLFHYSLNPGGVLFLGSAETIGGFIDLFSPMENKLRIFRSKASGARLEMRDFPTTVFPPGPALPRPSREAKPAANLQALADQQLLRRFAPAAVLVNASGDILYVSGRTGKYLEPAVGKANFNVLAMAREGLRYELTSALQKAGRTNEAVTHRGLKVKTNDHFQSVDLTIQPAEEPEALRGLFFVVFSDAAPPTDADTSLAKPFGKSRRQTQLEKEIQALNEELATTREEMQTSQEELKSANEELQSANEELQSTNEELTTSKEEMQSLNEELQTLNAELQSKLDELLRTNNDMKNLLNSTEIATVFLDNALNVRRFTPQATRLVKLISSDTGRPFTDIVTDLCYPELVEDVQGVLSTLCFSEKQVATRDGRWFTTRIMPYRTIDNVIDGVVLTFVDITAAKALEAELRRLGAEAEPPVAKGEP